MHGLSAKGNKEVKGDLLNLYWSNAPLQVYVVPLKYLKSNSSGVWRTWYINSFEKVVTTYARVLGLRNFRLIDYEELKPLCKRILKSK